MHVWIFSIFWPLGHHLPPASVSAACATQMRQCLELELELEDCLSVQLISAKVKYQSLGGFSDHVVFISLPG